MKNKILFALLVLVLAFSLVGCGPYASEGLFLGKWKNEILDCYEFFNDGTWTYEGWISSWDKDNGTWVHNGDNTITFINEEGEEKIAIYCSETEGEGEDKTETEWLLIEEERFYAVEN